MTLNWRLRLICVKLCRRQPGILASCAEQEIIHSPCVLKSCFNASVLSNLEYCAPVWMSPAESHLSLRDRVVRSADRLCENELCCLGHRKGVSALCLLYKIYHLSLHEYLQYFVSARNTRASDALCELAFVIPRCKTDQFNRSFSYLLRVCATCCRRGYLVVVHWALLRALWTCPYRWLSLIFSLSYFDLFWLFYSFCIMVLSPFWFIGMFFP